MRKADSGTAERGSPVPTHPGRRMAPGPRGIVAIPRNLRAYQRNAPQFFFDLSRTYGSVVRIPLGLFTAHLVSDPESVGHVLQDNNQNYVRGLGYEKFKTFMGLGLLTTDGEQWRQRRRIVNPMFHKTAVESMAGMMTDATTLVLDGWQRQPETHQGINVVPEMMKITLGATGKIMFDADLRQEFDQVAKAMSVVIEAIIFRSTISQLTPQVIPIPYNLRIRRAKQVLYKIFDRIADDHRAGRRQGRADVIDLMLSARDEETGAELPKQDIRDEMLTTILAGHESSGTGLAWALYELARHPDIQERTHEEVERVLSGRVPTVADVERLPYTRMVVDETFRLHPPIWLFPRDSVQDDDLAGWHIPARSTIFLMPYVTHRSPDYWVEPERFDPERFSPERAAQLSRHVYYPFGAGQRKCIGAAMALLQTHLSLAMIMQRFRVRPMPDHPVEVGTLVTLRPLRGVKLAIEPRRR